MLLRNAKIDLCSPAVAIAAALAILLIALFWGMGDGNSGKTGAHAMTMPGLLQDDGMAGDGDRPCPLPAGASCVTLADAMASLSAPRPFAGTPAAAAVPSNNRLVGLLPTPPRRPPRTAA